MIIGFWPLVQAHKIEIPIIQRDYAQGRELGKAPRIREAFLRKIFGHLKNPTGTLELDFVYGHLPPKATSGADALATFIPLDGQQRLTTLYLLHWYAACKAGKIAEASKILARFSYETRHSSGVFCGKLSGYCPEDMTLPIKAAIINEPWFLTAWKNDPTISSMLIMLDAIQAKDQEYQPTDLWTLLTAPTPTIMFHLLPMERLSQADDLYIKMNSRGKELTEFEYFKSRFSEVLEEGQVKEFDRKVDQGWSDLFWNLYKEGDAADIALQVDEAFLRFFDYVTDLLLWRNHEKIDHAAEREVKWGIYRTASNTQFLFQCLNLFQDLYKDIPLFFEQTFRLDSVSTDPEKVRLFFQAPERDLFHKCCDKYEEASNQFTMGEQLLLYACMIHLLEKTEDFPHRLRIIRNLIASSNDQLRRENMPSFLQTVDGIVRNGVIDSQHAFNKTQASEEISKRDFLVQAPHLRDTVFQLEDHELLQGCLAIFRLDSTLPIYASQFEKVFTTLADYGQIGRAILTFGDYSQGYTSNRRRLGSNNKTSWRELFTPSVRRDDFVKTQTLLYKLLEHLHTQPTQHVDDVITHYLESYRKDSAKPKDWIYYNVWHDTFRGNEQGFFYWDDDAKPYELIVMRKTQRNGRLWSPFLYSLREAFPGKMQLDDYMQQQLTLVRDHVVVKINNLQQGYQLEISGDPDGVFLAKLVQARLVQPSGFVEIRQDASGTDLEDRMEKGKLLIDQILVMN